MDLRRGEEFTVSRLPVEAADEHLSAYPVLALYFTDWQQHQAIMSVFAMYVNSPVKTTCQWDRPIRHSLSSNFMPVKPGWHSQDALPLRDHLQHQTCRQQYICTAECRIRMEFG